MQRPMISSKLWWRTSFVILPLVNYTFFVTSKIYLCSFDDVIIVYVWPLAVAAPVLDPLSNRSEILFKLISNGKCTPILGWLYYMCVCLCPFSLWSWNSGVGMLVSLNQCAAVHFHRRFAVLDLRNTSFSCTLLEEPLFRRRAELRNRNFKYWN